jgi:hypothetical protein
LSTNSIKLAERFIGKNKKIKKIRKWCSCTLGGAVLAEVEQREHHAADHTARDDAHFGDVQAATLAFGFTAARTAPAAQWTAVVERHEQGGSGAARRHDEHLRALHTAGVACVR